MNRSKSKAKMTSLQEEDSQPYYHPILEQQMIIRFPADIAARLTASMEDETFEDFKIKFVDRRHATVKVFGETLNAVLVSLPTMVETHRTVDGSHLFKSADVSEMLIVHRPNAPPKWISDEFVSEHGLTPPTFNIVSKRLARQAAAKDGQADQGSLEGIEYWEMVEIQLSALLSKDRTAKPICRQQFLEEPDVDAVTLEKALRRAGMSQFKGYSGQEIDESELMSTENEPNVRVPPEVLAQIAPDHAREEEEEAIRELKKHNYGLPLLSANVIEPYQEFEVGDLSIKALPVMHGMMEVFGYRIGAFAYITDVSQMSSRTLDEIKGVKVLVLGALRERRHPTHFTFKEAYEVARESGCSVCYFTHISHETSYAEINKRYAPLCLSAYDNMVLEV